MSRLVLVINISADTKGRSMDDSNPPRKAQIPCHLYNIDQFVDVCLYTRGAGLGSYCQLDVYLGSCDSDVRRIV